MRRREFIAGLSGAAGASSRMDWITDFEMRVNVATQSAHYESTGCLILQLPSARQGVILKVPCIGRSPSGESPRSPGGFGEGFLFTSPS